MAMNLPSNPTNGQEYVVGAVTYVYDTTKGVWNKKAVSATANTISNTPAGNISATTVQGAINELDSEKVAKITSTANKLVKFSDTSSTITNSGITEDANGNVGIGTSSPSDNLHIKNSSTAYANIALENSSSQKFEISTAPSNGAYLYAPNGTGSYLGFWTLNSERLRIDSSGNVGIGTSSPNSRLHVKQTGNTYDSGLLIQASSGTAPRLYLGVDNATSTTVINNDNHTMKIESTGANPLTLGTNGTERLRIDSSGNVGIGVTPSVWGSAWRSLGINNYANISGAQDGGITITTGAYNDGAWKYNANTRAVSNYTAYNGSHAWYTAPSGTAGNAISWTNAMALVPSSPTTANNNQSILTLDSSTVGTGTNSGSYIIFKKAGTANGFIGTSGVMDGTSGTDLGIQSATGKALKFYTNNSTTAAMTLDASGSLLVGTTTSNGVDKLQVNGSISQLSKSFSDFNIAFVPSLNDSITFWSSGYNPSASPGGGETWFNLTSYTKYVGGQFYITQVATSITGRIYTRYSSNNGSTWSSWVEK